MQNMERYGRNGDTAMAHLTPVRQLFLAKYCGETLKWLAALVVRFKMQALILAVTLLAQAKIA
jgi:hypothetical protein